MMSGGLPLLGALQQGAGDPATGAPVCSRAGCQADARHEVRWRNPRIHDASRVKAWRACELHVSELAEFVRARGFLLEVVRLGEPRA